MARGNKRQASNALAKFPVDFPTGVLQDFAGTNAPEGWLLCDGSEVSRTEYAALYAVIGDTYGAGDGSTTFNLPDERGMFRRGLDDMGTAEGAAGVDVDGTARTVGQSQGDIFKQHSHRMFRSTGGGDNNNVPSYPSVGVTGESSGGEGYNGSTTSNGLNEATGGSETRPINHAYYVIIKA